MLIDIPGVKTHVPVLRFLLITPVLLPEQVIARVRIILDSHIERTLRVHVIRNRRLDVDRAQVRIGDGGRGVSGSFSHPLVLVLLGLAPRLPLQETLCGASVAKVTVTAFIGRKCVAASFA